MQARLAETIHLTNKKKKTLLVPTVIVHEEVLNSMVGTVTACHMIATTTYRWVEILSFMASQKSEEPGRLIQTSKAIPSVSKF